jgi:hypothetical protein
VKTIWRVRKQMRHRESRMCSFRLKPEATGERDKPVTTALGCPSSSQRVKA